MKKVLLDVYDINKGKIKLPFNEVLKAEIAKIDAFNYHPEVIKALATLKRSELIKTVRNSPYYAKYNKEIIAPENVNVYPERNNIIIEAINATEGKVVVSGDKAVDLYFTKCCGGGTANSEEVTGYRINYLRKILCKLCEPSKNEDIIKVSEIAEKLNITKVPSKEEIDGVLTDVLRDETGRIININVMGNPMTGDEFARLVWCKSSRIYFQENSIILKSIGEGNGLGICLEGADKLACKGFNYIDIINYYYTGVEIVELNEAGVINSLKGKRIVIDPGHGGSDEGNSFGSILEKDVNLCIALELEKRLNAIDVEVTLTRHSDINVPSSNRVDIINESRPDLFISIHQNSFMFKSMNGIEAYCYDMDSDAIKLSEYLEFFISQDLQTKNRGVKIGDYYLLRETKVSGIILECMYMSGDCDSHKYITDNYKVIANSIFKGICKFYDIEQ